MARANLFKRSPGMKLKGIITVLCLLTLSLAGCASSDDIDEATSRFFKEITIQKQKLVLMPGKNGTFEVGLITESVTGLVPAGTPGEEVSDPDQPGTSQLLITGEVKYFGFLGGSFLVEARGTRSCEEALCADKDSPALASMIKKIPGYYTLVVPNEGQALFVVATYIPKDNQSKSKEIYLGVLDGRKDYINFDFTPDDDPPTPPHGPDDLTIP